MVKTICQTPSTCTCWWSSYCWYSSPNDTAGNTVNDCINDYVQDLTWESHHTEGCREEYNGVTDIVEVEILNCPGAQYYEEDHEHAAVEAVVEVGQGWCLHLHEAHSRQGRRQHDEQGHGGADGGVLDPQDVPAEEKLELAVLKPVAVEESGEGHLPVAGHRLHAVVHVWCSDWDKSL